MRFPSSVDMEFRIYSYPLHGCSVNILKGGGGVEEPQFQRNGDDSDGDGIMDNLWNNTSY